MGSQLRCKHLIIFGGLSWDGNVFLLLIICLTHFRHQQCLHVKVKKLLSHQLRLYNQCEMKRISIYFGNTYVECRLSEIDVSTPELQLRRKIQLQFEVEATPEYPITVQVHYRRIYFEVIYFIVSAIIGRS